MKRLITRSTLVVALSLGLASAGLTAADAAGTHHHNGTGTHATKSSQKHAIEAAYRAAVLAAKTTLHQSLAAATTALERQQAHATYQLAVATAATVRANALTDLGLPVTPVKHHKNK